MVKINTGIISHLPSKVIRTTGCVFMMENFPGCGGQNAGSKPPPGAQHQHAPHPPGTAPLKWVRI